MGDLAVANCVAFESFNDLQKHVEKIQSRLADFDAAFTNSHNEVVQFQAQLVAKMEDIVKQSDEHNTHAASERETEKNERTTGISDLRDLFSKGQADQDRQFS